jgi:hypothetical protein
MAVRQSEILGLFASPRDIMSQNREQIAQQSMAFDDPIARQLYQSASTVTGALGGALGAQTPGMAEAQQIEEIRTSVPFDADNQSTYYTQLGQRLINQGLTRAGVQALELAKQTRMDEAKMQKDAQGKQGSLGAADKKAIREASDSARQSRLRSVQAQDLRNRFLEEQPMSGIIGSVIGSFKNFVGDQTELDNLKKEYEGLRISDGMANLPPGAASDKDVELALSRFPQKDDNPAYIARFLNGLYKASVVDAEYNNFYAQYLSDNFGDSSGADQAWEEAANQIDWEGKYGVTWNTQEGVVEDTATQTGGTVDWSTL